MSEPVIIKKIPTGKRTLTQGGHKKRPPLSKAGLIAPLTGQLGAPTHQRRVTQLVPKEPGRMSVENQIKALNRSIRDTLKEVVSLVENGHFEKAVFTCGLIATKQNRIKALAMEYEIGLLSEIIPAIDTQTKPKTKTVRARKTYKTWSKK